MTIFRPRSPPEAHAWPRSSPRGTSSQRSRDEPPGFRADERQNPPVSVDEHLPQLRDPDWLVRCRAIAALASPSSSIEPPKPGDPRAIEPLLELADDPIKNVRAYVAWALGAIALTAPGRDARDRVRRALADTTWRVRFAATRAYSWLEDEPFAPLLPLLDDPEESVRWAAARTLANRGSERSDRDRFWDPRLLKPLLHALEDPAPTVRAAAVRGLRPENGERSYAALVRALRDSDSRVRLWPSMVLHDRRAVPALIDALDDTFFWVRANAARNLGRLRADSAVDALIEQLRARDRSMRREASRALAQIGDPRAIDPLTALLNRSTAERVRRDVAHALEALGRSRRE
jgi:HEAT repeat protein